MRKGLFSLVGFLALIAVLIPLSTFVATAASSTKSHTPHIFAARSSSRKSTTLSAAAVHVSTGNSPYSAFNLTYQNGPVMTGTTNVYAIFWEPTGSVSANYNSLIEQYFKDVGNSPLYKNLKQYTDSHGQYSSGSQLAGTWVDTGSYPTSPLLDSDIQNEVTHAQSVNGWTSSSSNVFFVFLEKDASLCFDNTETSCTPNVTVSTNTAAFCAYHNYFGTSNTIYAAMPYAASPSFNGGCTPQAPGAAPVGSSPNNDDADLTINVTSHEQMEAATDPLLSAWYNNSSTSGVGGYEIGDLCAWTFGPNNTQGADVVWNGDGYIVQQEWDNAISGCVLSNDTTKRYFQLVNHNSGLVMDVAGASKSAGAQVIQWSNHLGLNQQWALVPDGPFYQVVNRNSGLVLDVSGASTNTGANVVQYTNHNGLNQQWVLVPNGSSDEIVNLNSNLVLDVSNSGTSAGGHVVQEAAVNSASQQWSFTPIYKIENIHSSLVLDVYGGGKNSGAHAIQWPYHNGLNQQWALIPDGTNSGNQVYQIENVNSGLVLDVSGGGKNAGAQAIQWTNHNGLNQQWILIPDGITSSGTQIYQIENVNSGLVLDVSGGSTNEGANAIQYTNHNGSNQQWELLATS